MLEAAIDRVVGAKASIDPWSSEKILKRTTQCSIVSSCTLEINDYNLAEQKINDV